MLAHIFVTNYNGKEEIVTILDVKVWLLNNYGQCVIHCI